MMNCFLGSELTQNLTHYALQLCLSLMVLYTIDHYTFRIKTKDKRLIAKIYNISSKSRILQSFVNKIDTNA